MEHESAPAEPVTEMPQPTEEQTELTLSQMIDRIIRMPARDTITVRELIDLFGEHSIYAAVLIASLPVAIPYIGIDWFIVLLGLPLCIVGGSMIAGAHRIWLPPWLAKKELPHAQAIKILKVFNTGLDYAERFLKPRLPQLVSGIGERAAGAVFIVLSICLFFAGDATFNKEYGPTAIFLLSLGLVMRDGYVMIAGYIMVAASFALAG